MIKMFHPSSSALLVAGALLLGDSFPIREISAFTSPLKATSTRKPWTTSSNPIRAQNKGFMSANPATSDAAGHDEAEEAFNVAADGVATRESTKAFFEETAQLCQERNIAFDKVKNARDLASVRNSPIKANRIFRTGKLSDCSANDIEMAFKESTDKEGALKIRTIIDLRSPTELKEDEELHRRDVFGKFTTMDWVEGKRSKYISNSGKASDSKGHTEERGMNSPTHTIRRKLRKSKGGDMVEEFCFPGRSCDDSPTRKERHFVSLMDEFKYVRGVVTKIRKRDLARVLVKSPGALLSKRVRTACKDVFLDEINDGGLPMLNELMLRMGASGIRYVLEVVSDADRYPVAFHCTAGKDRTGILSAIILSLVGVPDEEIVEDYSLSANVYAQINDHKAMVGALSQRNLNPKTFLGAPPHVMRDTLQSIRDTYGSVEGYCDWIGFGPEWREKLRTNLTS
jgi:protein tyrosine/serine phosphatase